MPIKLLFEGKRERSSLEPDKKRLAVRIVHNLAD